MESRDFFGLITCEEDSGDGEAFCLENSNDEDLDLVGVAEAEDATGVRVLAWECAGSKFETIDLADDIEFATLEVETGEAPALKTLVSILRPLLEAIGEADFKDDFRGYSTPEAFAAADEDFLRDFPGIGMDAVGDANG